VAGRIKSMKNSNDTVKNRIHDYVKLNYLYISINGNESKYNMQILCKVMWYASCWMKTE
jgi:hypothetical protein